MNPLMRSELDFNEPLQKASAGTTQELTTQSASAASPNSQPFRFLDLPGELRNLIYAHCLAGHQYWIWLGDTNIFSRSSRGRYIPCPVSFDTVFVPHPPEPHFALLAINHRTRLEVASLIYRSYLFLTLKTYAALHNLSSNIGSFGRAHIHHLGIDWSWLWRRPASGFPGESTLLGQFERLRDVKINVSARHSTLGPRRLEPGKFVERYRMREFKTKGVKMRFHVCSEDEDKYDDEAKQWWRDVVEAMRGVQ
ncbi:hypothetical protein BU16DRAFT_536267 [Lophium mytilinum]|uniref:F-box domain-containing protein n=1 Tax=Lophium mytilinum TaxID=390894 RepID=A0A6A6R464_9PEZI|nr:hypothetical protein BU16DRAFT_536267 [Lophium mytilinum]